jgi:RNase adapter protein RapZ
MNILIVSGISGSGKTTFMRALEDIGYFCVDNFPIILLEKFLELYQGAADKVSNCAFVVDIREREFFHEGKHILEDVKGRFGAKIIFLESSDNVLLRRYSETRRSHPLFTSANIKDAVKEERDLVEWIKDLADQVIDTTHLIPHELRRFVLKKYGTEEQRMKISLMSFGYTYGIPMEADMVFDVRFLSNPYFVDGLRNKTGLDEAVGDFIKSQDTSKNIFFFFPIFWCTLYLSLKKKGKAISPFVSDAPEASIDRYSSPMNWRSSLWALGTV